MSASLERSLFLGALEFPSCPLTSFRHKKTKKDDDVKKDCEVGNYDKQPSNFTVAFTM